MSERGLATGRCRPGGYGPGPVDTAWDVTGQISKAEGLRGIKKILVASRVCFIEPPG